MTTKIMNKRANYSKLTRKQAEAIIKDRRLYREIAQDYGVSPAAISSIKRGITWGWLNRG